MIIKSQYELCAPLPSADVATTLLENALRHGNKTAVVNAATGQKHTYQDLNTTVCKIGQALFEHGLRKGDVVLLLSPNCPEYLFVMLGALSIGVVISTANPQDTVGEAVNHLEDCGAKYVFTAQELAPKVLQACEKYGKARGVFVFGEAPGCLPYASLLNNTGNLLPRFWFDIKQDLALLPYSSGTTGRPKGVMLTHYNVLYNILQCSHPELGIFAEPGRETALLFLPMYHMFGIVVMLTSISEGNTLVVMNKYDLQNLIRYIKYYRPTFVPVVPPVMVQLTKSAEVTARDFESVKAIFYGAAPVGQELEMEWDRKFPRQRRMQGYGLTETSPGVTIGPRKGALPYGSIGKLIAGMEARIVHLKTDEDCSTNENGELWVRGYNIMKGYYNKPQQTRDTIDRENWFHTGDVARIDNSGYLYIVDRVKELIKYKGSQVAPAELESLLLGHPCVADCAVVGVPDYEAGELPRAYVVLKPGKSATEKEIQVFIAELVSPQKKLRGGVKFVEVVAKSPSGKILRRILKEQIREEIKLKAKL